jgi:hypothetical protein
MTSITTNASVKDFYVVIVGSNVSMVVQHSLLIAGAITMNITKQNMEIALTIATPLKRHPHAMRLLTAREQQQITVPCNNNSNQQS